MAITYECQVVHVHPVVNLTTDIPMTDIVLAQVLRIHVDDTVLLGSQDNPDRLLKPAVDPLKLRPMGRLGGNVYCTLGDMVDIPRPVV